MRRAFTIIELMVAVLLSSIVVLGTFGLLNVSSRTFQTQTEAAQTVDQLNFAMEQVELDLRRAGFLTVPNAHLPSEDYAWYQTVCAPPSWMSADGVGGVGHGIFFDEIAASGVDAFYRPRPTDQVWTDALPDRIVMLGAFRATRRFRPTAMAAGSQSITISHTPEESARIDDIFGGSIVAVTSPQGGTQFLTVSEVTVGTTSSVITTAQSIQADPSNGVNEACKFTGFGTQMFEVTPLQFVRYSVQNDPNDRASTVLVREELGSGYSDLPTPSRYVVARNIVDFQLWFDGVPALGASNVMLRDGNPLDADGAIQNATLAGTNASTPEDLRYAYVQMSGRLSGEVARNVTEGAGELRQFMELREWDGVNYAYNGRFTRLYTMRSEVELTNFTLASLR